MARQGKGVGASGPSIRGGGAAKRGAGASTRAGKASGVKGAGPKINSASPPPHDKSKTHGKVPGPPKVTGSGNFKPGVTKGNKSR